MRGRSFLDSNVLLYTDDASAPQKREVALGLYGQCRKERSGVLSTQVLQEYFAVSTRKLGVKVETARRKVELFARLDLVRIGLDEILAAIDLQRLHSFSFWDALIVRAAMVGGCRVLYSEDMQAGFRIGDLEIRDPFAELRP